MRGVTWALCLWPGLLRLWRRGTWSGLMLAVGFAVMLNVALVASFAWTEVPAPSVRQWAWGAVGVCWLASVLVSWRFLRSETTPASDARPDLFPTALDEYLKGHWYEAESLCHQSLDHDRHDVDTHLLVASICRRTGRLDEARERLDLLSGLEASQKWHWEIAHERKLLAAVSAEPETADAAENPAREAA